MKKIRARFEEMKEGFLTGKGEKAFHAYMFANYILIYLVFVIMCIISIIISNTFGIYMLAISLIFIIVFTNWSKAFFITLPISGRILIHIFGRYGRVVSKDDWKRIKKNDKNTYKFLLNKKNIGHCYAVSWVLAIWLKDAKLMYCSVAMKEGKEAHAVIVKNNCIYDTNLRRHYDFNEYIKFNNAEVYKIFDKKEYFKMSFFDDIYEEFVKWCSERNVHCDPQRNPTHN